VIGINSATEILAEVPSGIYADMRGRKYAFFLSCAFVAVSFILIYLFQNVLLLIVGIVFFGLGRAFLSGSLDSLIIEDCIRRNGCRFTHRWFFTEYKWLLSACNCSIDCFAGSCDTQRCFSQRNADFKGNAENIDGADKYDDTELINKKQLRIIMFCIFGSSITLFALETYWQPQFTTYISLKQHYLLGVLCACGYGGTMLGSFLTGHIKMAEQVRRWHCYLLFVVLLGFALCMIAIQNTAIGFMLGYVLAQTILGIANVPEQTLLNSLTASEARASMLSVASLFSQMAGVLSSIICTVLILSIEISGIFLVMGSLTAIIALTAFVLLTLNKGKLE
jgi:MFS family permease